MKKRTLLAVAGIVLAVALMAYARTVYVRANPLHYRSKVAQTACLLCGEPNLYRGADALLFVVVREEHWSTDNVGMVQYCEKDTWTGDGCEYDMYRDESLTSEELVHKNTPFSINGALKQHDYGKFTATHYLNMFNDHHGVTGALNIYSANGLITGALDISKCRGAGADYLCSILCQACFDKVYPITRHGNFFFSDALTGEVYAVCDAEKGNFDIRDYRVHVQLQDLWHLIFYVTYSAP